MVLRIASIAALLGLLSGCADKAVPDYAKCVEFDASGKIREAAAACEASISADPTSKAGKAAAEKLRTLQPALDQIAKEDAARQAQETLARQEQERIAAAALRARIKRQHTIGDEDDTCTSRGKPPLSFRYTGGTYDQNESVAYSDGCVAYDDGAVSVSGHAQNHFCCPR
jgi:hypothetical protein